MLRSYAEYNNGNHELVSVQKLVWHYTLLSLPKEDGWYYVMTQLGNKLYISTMYFWNESKITLPPDSMWAPCEEIPDLEEADAY